MWCEKAYGVAALCFGVAKTDINYGMDWCAV